MMAYWKFTVIDNKGDQQVKVFKLNSASVKFAEMLCLRQCKKYGCQLFVECITEEQAQNMDVEIQTEDDL